VTVRRTSKTSCPFDESLLQSTSLFLLHNARHPSVSAAKLTLSISAAKRMSTFCFCCKTHVTFLFLLT
jgi:hypothetical protein